MEIQGLMMPKWLKLQTEGVCDMRYHNITHDDMLNGTGLRVVLWVSGCTHCCEGCHNKITWDINDGILFDEKAKKELFYYLEKNYTEGITFSGGDPLHPLNRAEITALAKEIRERFPNKNLWLYTGFKWENIQNLDIMKYIDVLVDDKFIIQLKDNNLHWKGSSNQRVIDVKKSIEKGEVCLFDK